MKTIALVLVSLFIYCSCIGQVTSSIKLDRDSIGIGESVKISVELVFDQSVGEISINYQNYDSLRSQYELLPDSIEYFAELEWHGKYSNGSYRESINLKNLSRLTNGVFFFTDTLEITVWDHGVFSIPHPIISGASVQQIQSPLLMVTFPDEIVNPDTSSMILPIKDILTESKSFKDYIWILYFLLFTALIFFGFNLIKRRKSFIAPIKPIKVTLPAHVIAYERLDALRKEKLWEINQIKEYQSALTFAIREYLENRFNIPALESTTDEIRSALKNINFSSELTGELIEVLQIADLIKFAKAEPPGNIHESFLRKAENFIEQTKKKLSLEEETKIKEDYKVYIKLLEEYNRKVK